MSTRPYKSSPLRALKEEESSETGTALSFSGKKKKSTARWNLLLQLEYAAAPIPAGQRVNKQEIMSN